MPECLCMLHYMSNIRMLTKIEGHIKLIISFSHLPDFNAAGGFISSIDEMRKYGLFFHRHNGETTHKLPEAKKSHARQGYCTCMKNNKSMF